MWDAFWRLVGHSRFPLSGSLLARAGVLGRSEDRAFTTAWRGITYQGNLKHWIDRHIYFSGAYSPEELDFLERAAQILGRRGAALTLLDIGANAGQHSLASHRHFDRVIAFEPSQAVADRFERNVTANGITNIDIHRVALGDADATGRLGSGFAGNDGSRSLNWTLDDGEVEAVQVRHAGDYLAAIRPAIARVDVIKLDVEGHEKAVLGGLREAMLRDRPVILFELAGRRMRGGFEDKADVEKHLYPDHRLFALAGTDRARLEPFDWDTHEELVCLPSEREADFAAMMTDRPR